ncbi:type IV conjugative transfer system protein TraL [Vreelandella massiliensis]|uniref:type IV conjugative transfer system protein TraL n=1 Tax=Vreelandella massiliensis TaxID=1816686 RepID=UPI00096A5888|nr:type IV conjugative transfer system protein TraL [Halomonas massiliensis]
MEPVNIPTRCDEPVHIMFWRLDEMLPVFVGMCFGLLIGQVMLCMAIGAIITHFFKKYLDLHPDGFMLHIVYWYGVTRKKARLMINPYIRTLLP